MAQQDFTLKLITERAGGGDPIIRERRVPGPELTVGRAEDNAVVLADLSIDPRHAVIRATGPGRVSVESVSGLPFQVGNRSMQRTDVNVASKPVLTFGTYQIALEPAEGNDIAVVVTRQEEEHHPSPSVFSLKAAVFGRRRMAWILGLGILLVALLTPLFFTGLLAPAKIHPDQQWSSGPLSRAHTFLEDDCKSCHQKAFVAVRDEACLSCHKAGLDQAGLTRVRNAGSPFRPSGIYDHAAHDKLTKATPLPKDLGDRVQVMFQKALGRPTQRCANCHIEHTTPARPPEGQPRGPIPEKPTLVVVQDCEGCHSQLKMRLSDTQLIDTPDWNRHPKFRPLVTTGYDAGKPKLQRIAVASRPQDGSNLTFPHRLHLDSTGGVARQAMQLGAGRGYGAALDCGSCHRPDSKGGFLPMEMERDCKSCHSLAFANVGGQLKDLPHGNAQKVMEALNSFYGGPSAAGSNRERPGTINFATSAPAARSAFQIAFSPGGTCVDCHTITRTAGGVDVAPVKLQNRFLPRGGFNHAIPEHKGEGKSVLKGTAACADCHAAKTSDKAADFLVPDIAKCGSCHGKTKAQTPAFAPVECETCHSYHKPGAATPKPGHPKLETFRWSSAPARAG